MMVIRLKCLLRIRHSFNGASFEILCAVSPVRLNPRIIFFTAGTLNTAPAYHFVG